METGEEYSHSDSRTLSGSMRLLCSQLVDVVSVDAVELLLRMLRKESWEVRFVLCRCLCLLWPPIARLCSVWPFPLTR